jgi:Nucleotide-binding C-terminal domain
MLGFGYVAWQKFWRVRGESPRDFDRAGAGAQSGRNPPAGASREFRDVDGARFRLGDGRCDDRRGSGPRRAHPAVRCRRRIANFLRGLGRLEWHRLGPGRPRQSAGEQAALPPSGIALAVSGSCSGRTAQQIQQAIGAGWLDLRIDPNRIDAGVERAIAAATNALRSGRSVVAYTALGRADGDFSATRIGHALARLVEAGSGPPSCGA